MEKDIAIVLMNLIQFQSLKQVIDELIKRKYQLDIYVPKIEDTLGYSDMYDKTYNFLNENSYNPKRNLEPNVKYKILLESNPTDQYYDFDYKYRIKYKYSTLSAKPKPVYLPEFNLKYDCILCSGEYEADYMSVFAKTEVIGNSKYVGYTKKNKNTEKPVLLYLPTYGDPSSIDIINQQLVKIKDKFKIIAKLHHGTTFLNEEAERIKLLKSMSDEVYTQDIELIKLLEKADVVLSDNSGSIFEAIYAEVPVAIFAEDVNMNELYGFNTNQYDFVEQGYIPYTNNPEEIFENLLKAMSNEYIQKQKELREKIFYISNTPIEDFISVIDKYLNNNINIKQYKLHKILEKDYYDKQKKIYDQAILLQKLFDENEQKRIACEELKHKNCEQEEEIKKLKQELENVNAKMQKKRWGKWPK